MPDYIKLKGATTAPSVMADGEIALNEAQRKAYLRTSAGIQDVPLDRMAIELPDDNASSETYVFRDNGIAERVEYTAGGGAVGRTEASWRVFGVAPVSVGSAFVPILAPCEITFPTEITKIRVRVLAGTGAFYMRIYDADDNMIMNLTRTASGSNVFLIDNVVNLDPGRYTMALEGDPSVEAEVLFARVPWQAEEVAHAIMMSEAE